MTITVSTADPRSLKALAVLEMADRWQRGHLKGSGRSFFAIPSSADPTRLYMADARECTCPDFTRRGAPCKHVLTSFSWPPTSAARSASSRPPAPWWCATRREAGSAARCRGRTLPASSPVLLTTGSLPSPSFLRRPPGILNPPGGRFRASGAA